MIFLAKRFSSFSFQLFFMIGVAALFMALFFTMTLLHNKKMTKLLGNMESETRFLNTVKEIRYHFGFARKEEKNWLLFKNSVYLNSRKKSITKAQSLLADIQRSSYQPEAGKMLETLENHLLYYSALSDELALLKTVRGAENFTKKARAIDEAVVEEMTDITNFLLGEVDKLQGIANQSFRSYSERATLFLIVFLGLLILVGISWADRLRIRFKCLVEASQKLALGDYSPKLDTSHADELGSLASHFNEMVSKLQEREEKIHQFTQELIQANNLLKKGTNFK